MRIIMKDKILNWVIHFKLHSLPGLKMKAAQLKSFIKEQSKFAILVAYGSVIFHIVGKFLDIIL